MLISGIHLINGKPSAFSMQKKCLINLFCTLLYQCFLFCSRYFSLFLHFPFCFCDSKDTVISKDLTFRLHKHLFCPLWILWISV